MSKYELKPTIKKRSRISTGADEKGMILLGALALVSIIAVLATVVVTSTFTEIKLSSNYKTSTQAFYAAQAGTEEARARLRGLSSDPNYAGDPTADPDPTWSAYILTSSFLTSNPSWQTSDDPNYVGTDTNYIPTTSSHTNATVATNTLQTTPPDIPDISYWVKIRHKREADLFPAEQCTDNGSGTNDIIYYGYATSASTTLEQFTTTDANPTTGSPVDIITSYGSSDTSSNIIEIQTRKTPGPPILGAIYGDRFDANGTITINGYDACNSNNDDDDENEDEEDDEDAEENDEGGGVVAVAFVTTETFAGNVTIDSSESTTEQISALDMTAYVDALESTATVILTGDQTNYSVGSSSNYEVVYCDATTLSRDRIDITNLTGGYGTLVVRGKVKFSGNVSWHGLIIATGDIEFAGGGSYEIYGPVLSGGKVKMRGTVEVYYDSCEADNAKSSYRNDIFRWEDKNLN